MTGRTQSPRAGVGARAHLLGPTPDIPGQLGRHCPAPPIPAPGLSPLPCQSSCTGQAILQAQMTRALRVLVTGALLEK